MLGSLIVLEIAGSGPVGPWLVTPEEVGDPRRPQLTTHVDGELRQDGCTKDMAFGVDYLVWYLSQFMVLSRAT